MTPDAVALMRRNLTARAQQHDALALKAKSASDATEFLRGADTYRRLLKTLPVEQMGGIHGSSIDPPPTRKDYRMSKAKLEELRLKAETLSDEVRTALQKADTTLIGHVPDALSALAADLDNLATDVGEGDAPILNGEGNEWKPNVVGGEVVPDPASPSLQPAPAPVDDGNAAA